MAETLGVAASIVGIVSLGIQVTRELLKYYESWKDQDQDISDMCLSLESLLGTLMIISETIQPPAEFARSVTENIEKNIQNMKQAVNRLSDELGHVLGLGLPKQGVRALMRRHIRRALYHFKEETLLKIQKVISEARSTLDLALHSLQLSRSGISNIRRNVDRIVRWQENNETKQILDWLSLENFSQKQRDVSSQRQPGTGQWLLDHPDFLAWAEGNMETIWCLGSPGVGKTILSSAVVEFLEENLPVQKIGLAFLYCDHKRNQSQQLEYFISAIVRQLVERKRAIPKCVQTLYEKQKHRGRPNLNEYLELLQSLSIEYIEVYVVVDALDECIDKSRETIWNDMYTNLRKRVTNLRLLCTTRHIEHIGRTSSRSTRIEIRGTDKDMTTYIQAQIKTQTGLSIFCQRDANLQNDILQAVISIAEGMFLAAQLHVKTLASKTNLRAVKRALNTMPAGIDEIYDLTTERIKQHPRESLARRALSWIVYATRPLRVEEVQHAIAIDDLEPEDRSIAKDFLTPEALIVDACAGLIKIDEKSNIIGLVHKTAQEYFDRKGATHLPDAQLHIGTRCLKYLSLDVFRDGCCPTDDLFASRLRENKLLDYAAQNVANHVREETMRELRDLVLKFLMDTRKVSCATQVLFVTRTGWRSEGISQWYPRDFFGIHYAAHFGWTEILRCLIENSEADVDLKDSYGRTALSWAAENGHEGVVKLLIVEGKADVNLKDDGGRTALSRAAVNGHKGVVQQLIVGNAEVDLEDSFGQTALSWAAENGQEGVVQLLMVEGKANVDLADGFGQTALSWAVDNGHEGVVKLLQSTTTASSRFALHPVNRF